MGSSLFCVLMESSGCRALRNEPVTITHGDGNVANECGIIPGAAILVGTISATRPPGARPSPGANHQSSYQYFFETLAESRYTLKTKIGILWLALSILTNTPSISKTRSTNVLTAIPTGPKEEGRKDRSDPSSPSWGDVKLH